MNAIEILNELNSRGIVVEAAGDRLRLDAPVGVLTPELRAAISEQKTDILILIVSADPEVAWRVKAMLPQVPDAGTVPFLVAREAVEPAKRCCLSCGEGLSGSDAYRCTPCGRAANLAIELVMSGYQKNSVNEAEAEKRC